MSDLSQDLDEDGGGCGGEKWNLTFQHGLWLISRSLLALVLILLANWLQVPVDKFLELQRETDPRQREVESAIEAAREGNDILKKAELAVTKFERTVLFARKTNLLDESDRQRLAKLVAEAEAAVTVLSVSYGSSLAIASAPGDALLELIQTLERGLEALKASTVSLTEVRVPYTYEADLQQAAGYLRSIKAEIAIEQRDSRQKWLDE